jgi:hypothetical protein
MMMTMIKNKRSNVMENNKEIIEHIAQVIAETHEEYLIDAKELVTQILNVGDYSNSAIYSLFSRLGDSLDRESDGGLSMGIAYYDCFHYYSDEALGVNWILGEGWLVVLGFEADFSYGDWEAFREDYFASLEDDDLC